MTGACFVVLFGHGQASEHLESLEETAETLRHLINTACQAKEPRFADQCSVSVAPGGVMFALADDEPSRALELCRAVAALLKQQAKTHLTLPPVCAAITHGFLRQVDVLGFSSNFEGWPAIAAARVVAKLAPGECAIEQSVWAFDSLLREFLSKAVLHQAVESVDAVRVREPKRVPAVLPTSDARRVMPAMVGVPR